MTADELTPRRDGYWPLEFGDRQTIVAALQSLQHSVDRAAVSMSERWSFPTPAEGWTVGDQLAHLLHGDTVAAFAARDPSGFVRWRERTSVEERLAPERRYQMLSPAHLLERLAISGEQLVRTLEAVDAKASLPWFGPAMSADTFAVARVMEWWAHLVDVTDTVPGFVVAAEPSCYVAALGIRTRSFAYRLHGLTAPDGLPEMVLVDQSGVPVICVGEAEHGEVSGRVIDFATVVVRRRHVVDVDLDVRGDEATRWMEIAQAYGGSPGPGRLPHGDQ